MSNSYNKYCYRIRNILNSFTVEEREKKIEELNNRIGESKFRRHRYSKYSDKSQAVISIQELIVYKEVLELKTLDEVLSLWNDYQPEPKVHLLKNKRVAKA